MNPLVSFYLDLLARNPRLGDIRAVSLGLTEYGRGFNSPTITEHREALNAARAETES